GLKVGTLGKVGHDHFGDFLKEDLRKEGVDISKIAVSHKLGTSFKIKAVGTLEFLISSLPMAAKPVSFTSSQPES
ncbi:unnamed protein product, partial [marine sediment metagenome]